MTVVLHDHAGNGTKSIGKVQQPIVHVRLHSDDMRRDTALKSISSIGTSPAESTIFDIAAALQPAMIGDMDMIDSAGLADLLRHLPEWVRTDLGAKDANLRTRAEEALAAMIVSDLNERGAPQAISPAP